MKFDFRYMLMLRSVRPLKLYSYDVFWLRFANKLVCLLSECMVGGMCVCVCVCVCVLVYDLCQYIMNYSYHG